MNVRYTTGDDGELYLNAADIVDMLRDSDSIVLHGCDRDTEGKVRAVLGALADGLDPAAPTWTGAAAPDSAAVVRLDDYRKATQD